MKLFLSKSVYALDLAFLKEKGYCYLLLDLDNTLDYPSTKIASLKARKFFLESSSFDLKIAIVSNNTHKRLTKYLENVDVPFLSSAHKPATKRLKKFLEKLNWDQNKCLMLGDQVLTDYGCAKKMAIDFVLLEPLNRSADHFFTRINRLLERPKRAKILKGDYPKLKTKEQDYE